MGEVQERTLVSFDWAMKSILRDKANFDVLEGFLTTLLQQEITVLTLLESEANQQYDRDKFNRVDLLVRDAQNRVFVVEVQHAREPSYLKRLLYGASKLVVENIELGEPFEQIKKIVSISILYFTFDDLVENTSGNSTAEAAANYLYHGWTEFYGLQNGKKLQWGKKRQAKQFTNPDDEEKRRVDPDNVFPEYYLIEVEQFKNIIQSEIDEWIYFFKNSRVRDDFRSKNMHTLRQKLDLLHMSAEDRKAYDRYMIDRVSAQAVLENAKNEGIEEGIGIGKELGKEEERRTLAHKLLAKGMTTALITELTGLRADEIAPMTRPNVPEMK